jgi:hypothetical protein
LNEVPKRSRVFAIGYKGYSADGPGGSCTKPLRGTGRRGGERGWFTSKRHLVGPGEESGWNFEAERVLLAQAQQNAACHALHSVRNGCIIEQCDVMLALTKQPQRNTQTTLGHGPLVRCAVARPFL